MESTVTNDFDRWRLSVMISLGAGLAGSATAIYLVLDATKPVPLARDLELQFLVAVLMLLAYLLGGSYLVVALRAAERRDGLTVKGQVAEVRHINSVALPVGSGLAIMVGALSYLTTFFGARYASAPTDGIPFERVQYALAIGASCLLGWGTALGVKEGPIGAAFAIQAQGLDWVLLVVIAAFLVIAFVVMTQGPFPSGVSNVPFAMLAATGIFLLGRAIGGRVVFRKLLKPK